MAHINTIIPDTLGPLQFAYHPSRSTDDTISIALYSLFTRDCMAADDSTTIITFLDNTTVVGLITDDETAYRDVVRDLAVCCQGNNFSLNVSKTKELIVN
jgi:hypothetical protein